MWCVKMRKKTQRIYETATAKRNQNSLQMYARQKAKSEMQLWTPFSLNFCYKTNNFK